MRPRSFVSALALVVASGAAVSVVAATTACSKPAAAEEKVYSARGAIASFGPYRRFANIAHEAIPGFMPAMTMPFEASDPKQLDGFKEGDKVAFTFKQTAKGELVLLSIARV